MYGVKPWGDLICREARDHQLAEANASLKRATTATWGSPLACASREAERPFRWESDPWRSWRSPRWSRDDAQAEQRALFEQPSQTEDVHSGVARRAGSPSGPSSNASCRLMSWLMSHVSLPYERDVRLARAHAACSPITLTERGRVPRRCRCCVTCFAIRTCATRRHSVHYRRIVRSPCAEEPAIPPHDSTIRNDENSHRHRA